MFGGNSSVQLKRDSFRQEIRRQDVEGYFYQKRLAFKQVDYSSVPDINIDQLVPELKGAYLSNNQNQIHELHKLAFKFTCDEDENKRKENIKSLLENKYLEECLHTLSNYPKSSFEVFRTLANSCQVQEFFTCKNELPLKECLRVAFLSLQKYLNPKDLSDLLVFIGNIAAHSLPVCLEFIGQNLITRLVEISSNADINLVRNICFCLHAVTRKLDSEEKLTLEVRKLGVQIILNAIKHSDSDMIHCEILHPLTVIYDPHPEIDQLILQSNAIQFIISTVKGEFIDATLSVIKQLTLSESIVIANRLIDLKILDIVHHHSNSKKKLTQNLSFLILVNLSYNDVSTSNKIVEHKVINRIFNGLLTLGMQEKSKCMSVILNLLATGDDKVFRKMITLQLLKIITDLLKDTNFPKLQEQILDCILRFLIYGREQADKEQQHENEIVCILRQLAMGEVFNNIYQSNQNPNVQTCLQNIQTFKI